jgi:probable F420-dependent oxidoreductase
MREVTLPALERGAAQAGKQVRDIEISCPVMVVTGTTEEEMQRASQAVRQQLAFYGSTPAYRPVLELHGWGGLQDELNTMSKRGEWVDMANLIDDEILDAFAVVGTPDDIAGQLVHRYGDMLTRVNFYSPYRSDPERLRQTLTALKAGTTA